MRPRSSKLGRRRKNAAFDPLLERKGELINKTRYNLKKDMKKYLVIENAPNDMILVTFTALERHSKLTAR